MFLHGVVVPIESRRSMSLCIGCRQSWYKLFDPFEFIRHWQPIAFHHYLKHLIIQIANRTITEPHMRSNIVSKSIVPDQITLNYGYQTRLNYQTDYLAHFCCKIKIIRLLLKNMTDQLVFILYIMSVLSVFMSFKRTKNYIK